MLPEAQAWLARRRLRYLTRRRRVAAGSGQGGGILVTVPGDADDAVVRTVLDSLGLPDEQLTVVSPTARERMPGSWTVLDPTWLDRLGMLRGDALRRLWIGTPSMAIDLSTTLWLPGAQMVGGVPGAFRVGRYELDGVDLFDFVYHSPSKGSDNENEVQTVSEMLRMLRQVEPPLMQAKP